MAPVSGYLLLCERPWTWSSQVAATARKSLGTLWKGLPDITGRASEAGLIKEVETNAAPCLGESKGFSKLICPHSWEETRALRQGQGPEDVTEPHSVQAQLFAHHTISGLAASVSKSTMTEAKIKISRRVVIKNTRVAIVVYFSSP